MDIYEKSELRMEYINGEIVLLGFPQHLSSRHFGESICSFAGLLKSEEMQGVLTRLLMFIFIKKIWKPLM